jgi:hypothetical protein
MLMIFLSIIFAHERDARRILDVLPKRQAKYGLARHPERRGRAWSSCLSQQFHCRDARNRMTNGCCR